MVEAIRIAVESSGIDRASSFSSESGKMPLNSMGIERGVVMARLALFPSSGFSHFLRRRRGGRGQVAATMHQPVQRAGLSASAGKLPRARTRLGSGSLDGSATFGWGASLRYDPCHPAEARPALQPRQLQRLVRPYPNHSAMPSNSVSTSAGEYAVSPYSGIRIQTRWMRHLPSSDHLNAPEIAWAIFENHPKVTAG